MTALIFCIGWFIGFFMTRRYYLGLKQKVTIHMDAEQAANFIESDEAVKNLKKEMGV
jgi:hypothetical protein